MKNSTLIIACFTLMLTYSCSKDVSIKIPTVSTNSITDITKSTAKCGGNVTNDGSETLNGRGLCWSTTPIPTIKDSITKEATSTGYFYSAMTKLLPKTKYYVRAYASNSAGVGYGEIFSFTTSDGVIDESSVTYGVLKDNNGNTYKIVKIGTQVWMAENLKVITYNDGDTIPNSTNSLNWSKLSSGAFCNYNNSSENISIYGRIYNGFAVKTGKLCPTGWHIPNETEWTTLITTVGGDKVAGLTLKDMGAARWDLRTSNANNRYGFTSIPSGARAVSGGFHDMGNTATYWSSSSVDAKTYMHFIELGTDSLSIETSLDDNSNGYSVRCLRN